MRIKGKFGLGVAVLLASISAASAEGLGAFVGFGVGTPLVVLGSSDLGFKIFGGAKVQEFPIAQAGNLELAIQGEYVNFGKTTYAATSLTSYALGVDAVGTWVIPRKWAGWADEKLAVIVKLGGAYVSESWNNGLSSSSVGLAKGIGAEYRFIPALGVNVMNEQYPSYSLLSISGVFHF